MVGLTSREFDEFGRCDILSVWWGFFLKGETLRILKGNFDRGMYIKYENM